MATLLKTALKTNALFSFSTGVSCLVLPQQLGNWMNIQNSTVFYILGIGLIFFAAFVAFTAFQKEVITSLVNQIIVQDVLWVLVSIILLIMNPFGISFVGNMMILIVAIIVLIFAILQYIGLKRYQIGDKNNP